MSSSAIPADLKYTRDHEWARVEGNTIRVGITQHAVDQLGDITLVDVSAKAGTTLDAHGAFGVIESVKTVSDLYSPAAGTVLEVNADLAANPEKLNADPYANWIVVLQLSPAGLPGDLLDAAAYAAHVAG